MKNIKFLFLSIAIVLFTGCVATPQAPIDLTSNFFEGDKKIGIITSALPKKDVYLPGAGCLLCLAAAEAANSKLSTHVDTLSLSDLENIKLELSESFNTTSIETLIIEEPFIAKSLPKYKSDVINSAKKNFSIYSENHEITHLLVIDMFHVGMHRTYANYFPTSDPRGYFSAAAYLVNLSTNTFEWYKPINIMESVNDEWKEPPNFPALTNAYYRAIAKGKDEIFSVVPR